MLLSSLLALGLAAAPVPTVHVHAAGDAAFRGNAYLVETPKGVVAVDALFTVSEAKALRAELEALHKPLLAVLVTHAHPDHVNGIGILTAGAKVPVLATAGVLANLKAIDAPKRAYWGPLLKEEYPAETTFPNRTVKDGEQVTFDGVTFTARDVGPGESESETLWILEGAERAVFTGDLVMNRVHAWLADGHSGAWLKSLAIAEPIVGKAKVYPGHGAVGGPETLAWQKQYLTAYREAVKALAAGKPALSDPAKKELAARMEKVLPAAPLVMLVGLSADPIAAELSSEGSKGR